MRKRNIKKVLLCVIYIALTAMPLNVNASGNYGEMKAGFFVKTFYEEVQTIPYEKGTEEYEKEFQKIKEARYLTELTPEMKAAGYVLVNGVPYSPQEAGGEAGEVQTKVSEEDKNGTAMFNVTVPEEVKSSSSNCYIEVTEANNDKIFYVTLYKANSFSASEKLPIGEYEVTGGGIENDVTSAVTVSGDGFTVVENGSTLVNVTIKDNSITEKAEEIAEQQEREEKEQQEHQKKEQKNKNKAIVFISCMVSVLCIAAIAFWVKRKYF